MAIVIGIWGVGSWELGVGSFAQTPNVIFRDVAAAAGLNVTHVNGASPQKYFAEIMGSGGVFFDFDDDGWIDMQVQFLIDKKSAGADHVVGWTVLKPGARHENHRHHNCDEFFIVLKGKGEIYTDHGNEPSGREACFTVDTRIEDGYIILGETPGLGMVFDEAKQQLPEALRSSVATIVGSTEPRQGLIDSAQQHKVDLLVVGATGTGFVTGLLLGSVGRATIYAAPCPVLVVGPEAAGRGTS